MLKFGDIKGPVRKFAAHHVLSRGETHAKKHADEQKFALRKRPIEGKMQQCFATINHSTASLDVLGEYFLSIGAIGRLWLSQHRASPSRLMSCDFDDGMIILRRDNF